MTKEAPFPLKIKRQSRKARDEFVRRKVELARKSMRAGRGRTNDKVEAAFAARRARARKFV